MTERAVTLPTGATLEVATDEEQDFLDTLASRYIEQLAFTSASDLVDLDRVLEMELISHRWNRWVLAREDYAGRRIDDLALADKLKGLSLEIRQLKKQLGIDRTTREKARGDGSVAQYLVRILAAAKEFGVHREEQLQKALELAFQLISLWQVRANSDADELAGLGLTDEDIFEWVEQVFMPEFLAIDAYFREHNQRFWVRQL